MKRPIIIRTKIAIFIAEYIRNGALDAEKLDPQPRKSHSAIIGRLNESGTITNGAYANTAWIVDTSST